MYLKYGTNIFDVNEVKFVKLKNGCTQLQAVTSNHEIVELTEQMKQAGEVKANFLVDRIAKKSNLFKVIDFDVIMQEFKSAYLGV